MRRSFTFRCAAAAVVPTLFVLACAVDPADDPSAQSQQAAEDDDPADAYASQPVGESVLAFRMRRAVHDVSETAARVRAVAQIVAGRALPTGAIADALRDGRDDPSRIRTPFADDPTLAIEYHPEVDEIRAYSIADVDPNDDRPDVGESAARLQAESVLRQLAQAGLVQVEHFDLAAVHVGYERSGGGARGQAPTERTEGYVFTYQRHINGIPCLNAGVRIGVDRSGDIDALRVVSLEIESRREGDHELPLASGWTQPRLLSDADARARFEREHEDGDRIVIHEEGPVYMLPVDADEAVVEPMYMVAYTQQVIGDEDAPIAASRRQVVAMSLSDPDSPAVSLFEATPPG